MDKMYWMHHVILGGKIMRSISIIKAMAEGTVQNFGPVTLFLEHYGLQTELLLDNNGLCVESLIMSRNFMHKLCGT